MCRKLLALFIVSLFSLLSWWTIPALGKDTNKEVSDTLDKYFRSMAAGDYQAVASCATDSFFSNTYSLTAQEYLESVKSQARVIIVPLVETVYALNEDAFVEGTFKIVSEIGLDASFSQIYHLVRTKEGWKLSSVYTGRKIK